jgi:hypothetical protein
MKAFAILSLILLSTYVSTQSEDDCRSNLVPIVEDLGYLVVYYANKDLDRFYKGLLVLRADTERATYDCNHAAGGSATPEDISTCFDDLELVYSLGDQLLSALEYDQEERIKVLIPQINAQVSKSINDCSIIFETRSSKKLLRRQFSSKALTKYEDDDKCLNNLPAIMKNAGIIEKSAQQQDIEFLKTVITRFISDVQQFQSDCANDWFKDEKLTKCYIISIKAMFTFKGFQDVSDDKSADISKLLPNVISDADDVISYCKRLFH